MPTILASSFVLPHAGGVEQFVATVRGLLEARGQEVRVVACRRPGEDGSADVTVPARFLGSSEWPLPVGGFGVLWREVGRADAVIANNALHPLTGLCVLVARVRGVPGLLVVHGSGEDLPLGSRGFRAVRDAFQRSASWLAVRAAVPVSVSWAGVEGVRRRYGVRAAHLPYPLPELRSGIVPPPLGDELRVLWVGRLSPEKDPELAVAAVDRLSGDVRLDMYGEGRLRERLEALAATRPWLVLHGARPRAEVLAAQERAHVLLSTSVWDNAQVALLEALARGLPAVSTRVGDAPRYLHERELAEFCVEPDAAALAGALSGLTASYDRWRSAFAVNGERLRAIHGSAGDVLAELIAGAGR
jgi:glycosyltransferase involved in cell wall biosynthesis